MADLDMQQQTAPVSTMPEAQPMQTQATPPQNMQQTGRRLNAIRLVSSKVYCLFNRYCNTSYNYDFN